MNYFNFKYTLIDFNISNIYSWIAFMKLTTETFCMLKRICFAANFSTSSHSQVVMVSSFAWLAIVLFLILPSVALPVIASYMFSVLSLVTFFPYTFHSWRNSVGIEIDNCISVEEYERFSQICLHEFVYVIRNYQVLFELMVALIKP